MTDYGSSIVSCGGFLSMGNMTAGYHLDLLFGLFAQDHSLVLLLPLRRVV